MLMAETRKAAFQRIEDATGLRLDEIERIERRALEIAADIEIKSKRMSAEVLPAIPQWHVLLIMPGFETAAMKALSERGFAVYDPMFDERYKVRGGVRTKRSRLLPGYLLVFVWGIDEHRDRIKACKGVTDILKYAGTDRAVVVPDILVEYFQGQEISTLPDVADACRDARDDVRKQFKPAKKGRDRSAWKDRRDALHEAGFIDRISTRSYLNRITELEPTERIGLFNRALGLPS